MRINHKIKSLLSVIVMAVVLPLSAQTPQCKDTAEHRRLQQAMWEASGQDVDSVVYKACVNFLHHAREDKDVSEINTAWICGIMYNLGKMNISSAYHIVQTMKEDITSSDYADEASYYISNMMGHVYNTCGNIPGAEAEFMKSAELIKGTPFEKEGLAFVYLALAHVHLNNDLGLTLYWLDETEKELKNKEDSWNYFRCVTDVWAIRAIVRFKQGDMEGFQRCIDQMEDAERRNKIPTGDLFAPYARIYKTLADGLTEKALEEADALPNLKERYLLKCDIYRYAGDNEKAFLTQRELMHMRDSITGVMIDENIRQHEEEVSLFKQKEKMSRRIYLILAHTVALAILVIILMARNILIRRRSRQRLLAKNEELREANRKVTRADEMKTQFIRNVSHEIRTPLNIINGFTQVLTNEENTFEPEERHEIAETIGTSTRQITSLVNKMLALANQNTKDLLKEVEETDALDICHKALQEMPPVDADRIKVELEDLTYDKGTTLCTNSDSLLQMLGNILENSVKFTEKGTIKLTLRNDGLMMWFTVEDTGCGIPEDKIGTIFERFTKVDEFKEGLGLGLAYCHETAERLGGVLRLDSTSEAGTSFTLGLPLKVKN